MKPFRQQKGMKVTGSSIQFSATPGVAPEGQQAVNRISARVPAAPNLAGAQSGVAQYGTLPGIIEYSTGAGQMATGARTACAGCRHHDVNAWRKFLEAADNPGSTAEMRETMRTMRAKIMMVGYGYTDDRDDVDIERTMRAHGICRPMSDTVEKRTGRDPFFWPVVTWRESNCPPSVKVGHGQPEVPVVTAQSPNGFFQPKDLDAEKIGAARYDAIMHAAQGKRG